MAGGTRSTKGGGRPPGPRNATTRNAASRQRTEARRAARANGPAGSPTYRRKRRRRVLGAMALLLALVVGVVGVVAISEDDDNAAPDESTTPITSALTSTVVAEQGEVLPIATVPASYRVVYRVETATLGGGNARTEEITVRRPFDARLIAYTDGGSAESPNIDARSNLGLYADVTDPDNPDVGAGMPAAALGDLRFDGSLADLVTAGVFVPRERREMLGRACQVYRTGQLVESPPLVMPSAATYSDVCIDAAGIVLEQLAFVDGVAETHEVATSVEIEPALDDAAFTITGEPLTFDEGGNELTEIDASVAPVSGYWVPSAPPLGATHVGRYLLRTPNPEAAAASDTTVGPTDPTSSSVDTYVDVYAAGSTFVVVNQGVADAATMRDPTIGVDVDAGALGTSRVIFGATGSTLVSTTDSWFVEITGPLPAATLGQIAATFAPS